MEMIQQYITSLLEQTSLSFTAMTRSTFLRCIKALELQASHLETFLSILTYLKLKRSRSPIQPQHRKLKITLHTTPKMYHGLAHKVTPHLPDLPGARYNPRTKEYNEKYAYLSPFAPDLGLDPPIFSRGHPFTRSSTFTCYINGCWRNFREKEKLEIHQRFAHSLHPLTYVGVDSRAFGPFVRPGDDDDVVQRRERDRGSGGGQEERVEGMVRRMGYDFFERNVGVGWDGDEGRRDMR